MLKSKDFGAAISEAIQRKLDSGSAKSKAEIARHFGMQPPSLSDWVKKGSVAKDKLPELWRYFSDVAGPDHWGLSASEWPSGLSLSPNSQTSRAQADLAGGDSNTEPGPNLSSCVPLISWVQAGGWSHAADLLQPGEAFEWIRTTVTVQAHTFALRVTGDSMEPDFPAGMVLVVEPEMDAHPGDFVIVRNGDNEATFKQLVRDGADLYLKPLNPRYPIKPLGSSHIVGVVREAVRKLR